MPSVHVSDLLPHPHQAAGHPGSLLISKDGSKVAKPGLPREIAFYETLAGKLESNALRNDGWSGWRPGYYGKVEGGEDVQKPLILIDNLTIDSHLSGGYHHPIVLDLKIGTQLWDPNASEEKRQRMDEVSRTTTTGQFGLRVTGGKVWDPSKQEYLVIPKEYGKGLSADGSQLLTAMSRFFPVSPPPTDNPDSAHATPLTITPGNASPSLLLQLLDTWLIPSLERLISLLGNFEWRVYGGSLLLVYEGNPVELERKLQEGKGPEGVGMLKMIDFAHAWDVEGEGRDEGLMKGLETTKRLWLEMRAEIGALLERRNDA